MPHRWLDPHAHTHVALDDAIEQRIDAGWFAVEPQLGVMASTRRWPGWCLSSAKRARITLTCFDKRASRRKVLVLDRFGLWQLYAWDRGYQL